MTDLEVEFNSHKIHAKPNSLEIIGDSSTESIYYSTLTRVECRNITWAFRNLVNIYKYTSAALLITICGLIVESMLSLNLILYFVTFPILFILAIGVMYNAYCGLQSYLNNERGYMLSLYTAEDGYITLESREPVPDEFLKYLEDKKADMDFSVN